MWLDKAPEAEVRRRREIRASARHVLTYSASALHAALHLPLQQKPSLGSPNYQVIYVEKSALLNYHSFLRPRPAR
jgi:hypothetical protein